MQYHPRRKRAATEELSEGEQLQIAMAESIFDQRRLMRGGSSSDSEAAEAEYEYDQHHSSTPNVTPPHSLNGNGNTCIKASFKKQTFPKNVNVLLKQYFYLHTIYTSSSIKTLYLQKVFLY